MPFSNLFGAIPHNSKCRYGERGAADAKPKAQIILDAAKVSAASGGCNEPKRDNVVAECERLLSDVRCGYHNPTLSSILLNADAMPPSPDNEAHKAGIVRYCT